MRRAILRTTGLIASLACGVAAGQDRLPASLDKIGLDQRLHEIVPAELAFRDETGRQVHLDDYFQGRPVILVLAQYRCPLLCNQVLNGLLDGLRPLALDAGKDFQVVVVSFDVREGPELAAAKKASHVAAYGRAGAESGWHFLTGEQPAIEALTQAVGFRYRYDDRLDRFAHASGIVVLTPEGRIARYFYGIRYPSRDLRLGLTEAGNEQISSPADRMLLLCYEYDLASGHYTLAVMKLVRLGGMLTLLALATFFVLARLHERRKMRLAATAQEVRQ